MSRDPERGELGPRIVIAMALVAAIAWTVPMVFFGREAAENTERLAGGAKARAGPGRADGVAPMDPVGKATDVQAQATLNSAIRVAQVYFAENGTYDGFGPEVAGTYDPTLTLTIGPARPGAVSVRGLTPTTVVLVAAVGGGRYLCAAAESEAVSFGRVDAQTPAACAGGWG